jgi:hypothetical protein
LLPDSAFSSKALDYGHGLAESLAGARRGCRRWLTTHAYGPVDRTSMCARRGRRRLRRDKRTHDDVTRAMTETAVATLRAGFTPADVAAQLPWTDRHVRQLGRATGIVPTTRGPKRQTAPALPPSYPG